MNTRLPPIPPENRAQHGPEETSRDGDAGPKRETNPDKRGQQANVKQNTTHQGYQQDR